MLLYAALVCGVALNLLEFGVCCSMLLNFAACYSTLLYFVVVLEFARGGSMLHVLFDVAICVCIVHSILLGVAALLFCLSLLVMLLYVSIMFMFALCCFILLRDILLRLIFVFA